ncbi:hypothetical protein EDD11_008635 [Mortierella claussenii]|nr:hypothetical protein EDD11_008635 [Mortierella claussenii]
MTISHENNTHNEETETRGSDIQDARDSEFDLGFLKIRKIFTLIFIHDKRHHQLLLGQKQRGALLGQWNGFGGKVERNLESVLQSAARELKEEAMVQAPLFPIGFIQWVVSSSADDESTYRDVMVVYKAHSLEPLSSAQYVDQEQREQQTPQRITAFEPSDEMAPAWWDIPNLPWESMRINHKVWYPFMLADCPYRGVYWYETKQVPEVREGAENAQRENAQEIWVEDLAKRCFQFGTTCLAPSEKNTEDVVAAGIDERTVEQYALDLGLTGACYSSTIGKLDHKSQGLKSSEPTVNPNIGHAWLQQAIAKAERDWTSS